jgi:hypothetical protein
MLSKQDRLREVFARMANAEPSSTFDEAYRLLCSTIDQVEDEHSELPNKPARWKELKRLFPPGADRMSSVEGTSVKRFDSLGHLTYIAPNGAIEIRTKRLIAGNIVVHFSKPGRDGRGLCEVCPQLSGKNL